MLGDLRILDTGDELLLDIERSALQAIFNVLHRARVGFDAELHKRTLQRGLLSLVGPDARRVAGPAAEALPDARARARAPSRSAGSPRASIVDRRRRRPPLRRRGHRRRSPPRCAPRGARAGARGGGRGAARRARAPALRRRPRRHDDPAGGRPQRARRLLHEGLLRRPGDGRAPLLQGQAEPPPARAAAVGARRRRHRADARRQASSAGSAASSTPPRTARSGWRSCAARPSPARRCPPARPTATVVRAAASGCRARRRHAVVFATARRGRM